MGEIERKFLVRRRPKDADEGTAIRQGYIAIEGDREVRVRERDGTCTLTVKRGRGRERAEVELVISPGELAELWPLAAERSLEKRRHLVRVEGAIAELDVYGGRHAGLEVVEVEFATAEDAERFVPPTWFGPEVTDDPRYSNARLAVDGPPARSSGSG